MNQEIRLALEAKYNNNTSDEMKKKFLQIL